MRVLHARHSPPRRSFSSQLNNDIYLMDDVLSITVVGIPLNVTNAVLRLRTVAIDSSQRSFESTIFYDLTDELSKTSSSRTLEIGVTLPIDAKLTDKQFLFSRGRRMGIFEVAIPSPGQPEGTRFQQNNVTVPVKNTIVATLLSRRPDGGEMVQVEEEARVEFDRYYFDASRVRRVEIFHPFNGVLFQPLVEETTASKPHKPNAKRNANLILDLFGTAGGSIEFRAALLASRGLGNVLSLAYFGLPGSALPKAWGDVDMAYFERVLQFYLEDPQGLFTGTTHFERRRGGVDVLGVSLGGELGILLGALYPGVIKRVVAIAGSSHIWSSFRVPWGTSGRLTGGILDPAKAEGETAVSFWGCYEDRLNHSDVAGLASFPSIPVERMLGGGESDSVEGTVVRRKRLMLIVPQDDKNWPCEDFAEIVMRRLESVFGRSRTVVRGEDATSSFERERDEECRLALPSGGEAVMVRYRGAGHLLEPPFAPICDYAYHRVLRMVMRMGGSDDAPRHSRASERAWERILDVLGEGLYDEPTRVEEEAVNSRL